MRLTRQGFWLIMKGLVRDAGLPAIMTPHMLRHSFATHQIGEGLGLEELRQLLGHASIATTQIYTQLAGQQSRRRRGNIPRVTPRRAGLPIAVLDRRARRRGRGSRSARAARPITPRVALILGSGLGDLADEIDAPVVVPYARDPVLSRLDRRRPRRTAGHRPPAGHAGGRHARPRPLSTRATACAT